MKPIDILAVAVNGYSRMSYSIGPVYPAITHLFGKIGSNLALRPIFMALLKILLMNPVGFDEILLL